jgi:hypothetical protein
MRDNRTVIFPQDFCHLCALSWTDLDPTGSHGRRLIECHGMASRRVLPL